VIFKVFKVFKQVAQQHSSTVSRSQPAVQALQVGELAELTQTNRVCAHTNRVCLCLHDVTNSCCRSLSGDAALPMLNSQMGHCHIAGSTPACQWQPSLAALKGFSRSSVLYASELTSAWCACVPEKSPLTPLGKRCAPKQSQPATGFNEFDRHLGTTIQLLPGSARGAQTNQPTFVLQIV